MSLLLPQFNCTEASRLKLIGRIDPSERLGYFGNSTAALTGLLRTAGLRC
jgi:hypothetical protein